MGRKNWGERIGRRMLVITDIIFIVCAVAILVTAIISSAEVTKAQDNAEILRELNLDTILKVVLFTAAAGILGALLGLLAVFKRYKRLLVFSVLIMFIVFAVQIAMGAMLLAMDANDVYNAYREDSLAGFQRREAFQEEMQCCGWSYVTEEFFPERVACIARHPTYTETCRSAVADFLDKWAMPAGIVLVIFAVLAFIALVGAMLVVCNTRSVKEDFFENPFSF